jgi:hypothetical protein
MARVVAITGQWRNRVCLARWQWLDMHILPESASTP